MRLIKKLFTSFLAVAIAVVMVSTTQGTVYAMTEGDMDSAQELTLEKKLKGSLQEDSDAWFKFTTGTEQEPWYRIGCIYKDEDNYGPHMHLYNEEGIELFEKRLNDGVNNFKDSKLDPNTTYYVYISFAKNTDYTVYVSEIQDDVSDKEDGAVTIYSGIKVSGKFECVSDSDVYTFVAGSSKTTLTASLKYDTDRRACIKVYDEDGKQLVNDELLQSKPETYTFETVKGQKYIVVYTSSVPSYSIVEKGGSYTLIVKSGSSDIKNLTMELVYNSETKDTYLFNGNTRLKKGTDYTISVGKVSRGKVTVTVKGKGTYSGKLSRVCFVAGD